MTNHEPAAPSGSTPRVVSIALINSVLVVMGRLLEMTNEDETRSLLFFSLISTSAICTVIGCKDTFRLTWRTILRAVVCTVAAAVAQISLFIVLGPVEKRTFSVFGFADPFELFLELGLIVVPGIIVIAAGGVLLGYVVDQTVGLFSRIAIDESR